MTEKVPLLCLLESGGLPPVSAANLSAPGGNRTPDLTHREMLYPLSYGRQCNYSKPKQMVTVSGLRGHDKAWRLEVDLDALPNRCPLIGGRTGG